MSIDVFDLDVTDRSQIIQHAAETAEEGGDKSACPVAPSDPMWGLWQRTWTDRRAHIEDASGAMARRTQEMKAEVRRQTEHLHYLQPDPCAEVATPEPRPDVLDLMRAALPHIAVNVHAIVDEFNAQMEKVAAAFTAAAPTLQGIISQFTPTGLEPPSYARRRHGTAATCPRHGPTRGGTCMKCARNHQ
jgi:hypothetical protein